LLRKRSCRNSGKKEIRNPKLEIQNKAKIPSRITQESRLSGTMQIACSASMIHRSDSLLFSS
jgi:hypothetical protein